MELFELTHLGKKYYFTSHKEDIINGETYKAIPINRKEITRSLQDNALVITAPIDVKPFNTMINTISADLSELAIYKYPEDVLLFRGRIIKITMNYAKRLVTLNIGQKTQLGNSMIPSRTYSPTCGYNFCDNNCGLNREEYSFVIDRNEYTIEDNNYTIKSNKLADINTKYKDLVAGGYVKTITDDRSSDIAVCFINKYDRDNNSIEVLTPFYGVSPKTSKIKIYYTCNKEYDTCKNTYNNNSKYGGFPFIPINNISTGSV